MSKWQYVYDFKCEENDCKEKGSMTFGYRPIESEPTETVHCPWCHEEIDKLKFDKKVKWKLKDNNEIESIEEI